MQMSQVCIIMSKTERRVMLKLRGGAATFQMEMERWHGVKREGRVCKECDSGEIKNMCHLLLQCSAWHHLRQLPLLEAMDGAGADISRSTTAIDELS